MNMKLKVKITGHKVHDVGYRYFLMSNAMDIGLEGFSARNRMSGEAQEVMVMVEGDEETIKDFLELIEAQKPEHAEVLNVAVEEYNGNIMRAGEYAQVCTALQLNKAIPLLLDIRDDLQVVRKNTDGIKANTDAIPLIRANTDALPLIKANTDADPQALEEIKGMREDIQPGYAMQFRQVQADVRAIKERLGMR
jgi:acylphosphatase